VLRRSQLRSFKSVAEILAYDTGWRRRPRVGASDEAYLDELVTCVTRRYVAEFHRDRVGFVRWYNRQITLYVFAKECRRLARTKQLRSSADLLVAAIAPAIRLLQQAEGHARAKDAPAARRARNRFLVHSLWLLPVAAGLGEFYRVFPGPVSVILGPLVLGGLVHAARRNAKYKLYLSWAIAAPSALVFDLLLHIGVIEAPSRLRLLTLLATHNGGWTWWVYIGQLAYGALCLTVALRAPWTRARLTVGAAFDQDNALPGGIKDDIDDAVNGAVLGDGPPPQASVAHDRRRTPRVNR
jgi:hypothetical protein